MLRRALLVFVVLMATSVVAQEAQVPPFIQTGTVPADQLKPPTLSETNTLKLRASIQQVEIAQLKMQLVQQEFTRAREAAQTLIQSLQVEGYTLDLDRMVYVPTPKEKLGTAPGSEPRTAP